MIKTYLLKYKSYEIFSIPYKRYVLQLKKVWFWGLFTTYPKEIVKLDYEKHNFRKTFEMWDSLIKTGKALR